MKRKGLKYTCLGAVLLFLYVPILTLIVYSFNASRTMGKWGGFSLKWYAELFKDSVIMDALWVTLSIAVLAALCATILGTAAAIGIDAMKKKRQGLVENITYIPMLSPDIVTGISMMMLFLFLGVRLGYGTMLLAHITFNLPYVIFSVLPKLRQLNPAHYEAALDLGAKPAYALRKIVLPQILPGIFTGFIFAFTLSIDDFVISYFTSQDVSNLSMTIYSMARRGLSPKINALSTIMFVSVMVLLIIVNVRSSRQTRKGASQ
ncbi:MAG: ABC transporter permease [Christensenellales bacterium]|jgi:spermidine/putrescine transport system permease protein